MEGEGDIKVFMVSSDVSYVFLSLSDTRQQGFTTYLGPLKIDVQNVHISLSANSGPKLSSLHIQLAKVEKAAKKRTSKKTKSTKIIIKISGMIDRGNFCNFRLTVDRDL